MENKNYYREEYLPGIIKYGKITDFLACIFVFVPALIVTFYYGIIPAKGPFMVAIVAQLSVNAVWWVIEPVSFSQFSVFRDHIWRFFPVIIVTSVCRVLLQL